MAILPQQVLQSQVTQQGREIGRQALPDFTLRLGAGLQNPD
jgi:hypothetical protein